MHSKLISSCPPCHSLVCPQNALHFFPACGLPDFGPFSRTWPAPCCTCQDRLDLFRSKGRCFFIGRQRAEVLSKGGLVLRRFTNDLHGQNRAQVSGYSLRECFRQASVSRLFRRTERLLGRIRARRTWQECSPSLLAHCEDHIQIYQRAKKFSRWRHPKKSSMASHMSRRRMEDFLQRSILCRHF